MNWIIYMLLFCNILTPLLFVLKSCVSGGRIEFNHVLLFSVGYLVYWISPIAVGESRLFLTSVGMPLWYGLFDRIPQSSIVLYLVMCLGIYGAFYTGVSLCQRLYPGSHRDIRPVFFDRRLLNGFLLLGLTASSVYLFLLRNELFRGFVAIDIGATVGLRGSFISISIFLLSLAFLYSFKQQEKQPNISFRRAVSHHFFASYFLIAFLILSLGGRLYFFSSILMLLVYRSVYFQRIGYRPVLFVILSVITLAGMLGTLRYGTNLSVSETFYNLVVEPLFNSFSLLQFLLDGKFDLINAPIFLLGDFINLVPTAILPGKSMLIPSPEDYGINIVSPFGSLSTFLSFMINFGFFGTMLFLFLMAFSLQVLRARGSSVLPKTIYVMICGWLSTTFFRDPFSVSLVKSIFQYSIAFPAIIVFTIGLVTYWLVDKPEHMSRSLSSE